MTEWQDDAMVIQVCKAVFHPVVRSRELSRMSADQLPEAVDKIQGWIADYCGYVAEMLYSNPRLQDKLFARLQAARKEIAKAQSKSRLDMEVALNNAIFEVHRVHARMCKEQELINKKSKLLRMSPIFAFVYFVMIILIIIIGWKSNLGPTEMPVIGIPLAVLLWSLIGSLAAILYRSYTHRLRALSQVSLEIAWLIARPLTGVIMGMVSYLIIVAGLYVFGNAIQTIPDAPAIRPQLLWVVAFLAGFSDKFFEGFIDTLVSKIPSAAPKLPVSVDEE